MTSALLVAVVLLLANAFFVAAEFAPITARRTRLEQLAAGGSARARMALASSRELSLTLAGAQLGVTMMSLGLGFVAEPSIGRLIESALNSVGLPEPLVNGIGFGLALIIVVFFHMVVGEMVPKNLAIAVPETSALWIAAPMRLYITLLRPVIRLLNTLANVVLHLFKVQARDELTGAATAEQLAAMVSESRAEGMLDDLEEELLSGALHFGTRTTASVMIPRDQVVAVSANASAEEVEALVVSTGHTRFPVYDGTPDNVVGYIHAKTLLDIGPAERRQQLPRSAIRPLLMVPATHRLRPVLLAMRRRRTHIAAVIDEGRRWAGLITMEDVLEQLIGGIEEGNDEPDDDADASKPPSGKPSSN
ncbi:MAG: hemolysin family protein [Acidimicrobiia bacterium]